MFDIVYITKKSIKGQPQVYHLTENLVDEEYEPLINYFPDEEVLFIGVDVFESYPCWTVFSMDKSISKVKESE